MTTFIAHNSVTRRYLKRGELMAKRRAEASQNALQQESRKTTRVDRATSLDFPRDYVAGEQIIKPNRVYYSDANPFGNKIHAVQKMKLSSKPLI